MTCYINIYKHSNNGKYVCYGRHDNDGIVDAAEDCQCNDKTNYEYLHTFKVVDDRIKQKTVLEYDEIIREAQENWDAYKSAGTLSPSQTWQT